VSPKQAYFQLPEVESTRSDVPHLNSWRLAAAACDPEPPPSTPTPALSPSSPGVPDGGDLMWARDADLTWQTPPTLESEEGEEEGEEGKEEERAGQVAGAAPLAHRPGPGCVGPCSKWLGHALGPPPHAHPSTPTHVLTHPST
jgi:hypothetical protein